MKLFIFYYFLLLNILIKNGNAARILGIFPTISRSHHIWNLVLTTALSRDHDVVMLSPFQEKSSQNLRHILLEDSIYTKFHSGPNLLDRSTFTPKQHIDAFFNCCFDICKQQINFNGSLEVLNLKGSFDLLIMESFGFECFFGFVPYFNLPTIAVSAHGNTPWNNQQMDVPEMSSIYPLEMFPCTPMTLWQRSYNTLLTWYMIISRQYQHLPKHEANAREVFGESMPSLTEIERSFSIFIVNAGLQVDVPRPHPPAVIEVGCLHCRPGQKLSQDIQEFLDSAKDGVAFFSLGSNVRSDKMSQEKLNVFLTAFSKLRQRVLWKWESDSLPGQPSNVKLSKWLSQQDVLAHPNVQLFITHGGRLSTQETVYHGVPALVIPVFYDQYLNGHRLEEMGLGIRLDFNNVSETALSSALQHLLYNQKFTEAARHQSMVSRDQPETPLARAVFWIEYVLRHKGAPHLRSAALELSWYQIYLLDVMALVFCILVCSVALPIFIVFRCCRRSNKKENQDKKTR